MQSATEKIRHLNIYLSCFMKCREILALFMNEPYLSVQNCLLCCNTLHKIILETFRTAEMTRDLDIQS